MDQVNNIVEACDHTQEHYNGHDKGRNSTPPHIRNLACCAASIVVVEYSSGVVKDLLTSNMKHLLARHYYSKIRVDQWSNGGKRAQKIQQGSEAMASGKRHSVDGQLCSLMLNLKSGKLLKVFVENRVPKMAPVTEEVKTQLRYCAN